MSSPLLPGFNIHPRWVEGAPAAQFLDPLIGAGLRAVEFELHPDQLQWPKFPPLMEACHALGLAICFHAPYRQPYTIAGFAGVARERRKEIEVLFTPMLRLAEGWAQVQGWPAAVVIHPARSNQASFASLYEDTRVFLAWALERFPSLLLALENMGPAAPGEIKIGAAREDVLRLVEQADTPRLGICWDMGHDALHHRREPPDVGWLRRVVHAHVHDLDENGMDHYPLVYGRAPVCGWLRLLQAAGARGVVTLEIKGGQLAGWEVERICQVLAVSLAAIRGCAA